MFAWLSWLWYEFWRFLLIHGFIFGFSYRIKGRHNLPRHGPVLLIANHESFIDPLLVGVGCPRQLWYLARKSAFHGLLGWYLPSVHVIPVDQAGVAKEGLKKMVELLKKGQPVLIFPEGQRSWDGVLQEFRPGILLLLRLAAPPIVPVGIAGSHEALPRARKIPIPTLAPLLFPPSPSTLAVVVGKPIDSTGLRNLPREQILAALFEMVKLVQQQAEHLRRK
jgi:1-acyl-sn-glycerol-3-phosphate acyltransferase